MNRRRFIQYASTALAAIPFLRHVVKAEPAPVELPMHQGFKGLPYIVENSGTYHGLVAYQGPSYAERVGGIVKVTGFWKESGRESAIHECAVNESAYIELPDLRGPAKEVSYTTIEGVGVEQGRFLSMYRPPDFYRIYAPLKGFEKTGPFYYLRQVSYRDAKRARFTVAVDYDNNDLIPQFAPGDYKRAQSMRITFPEATDTQ